MLQEVKAIADQKLTIEAVMIQTNKRFLVALSFPGEHRKFVANVAQSLASKLDRQHILYDKFYEAEFARPNLETYLQALYHDQSELVVVFLCADYERKEWTGLEWRAIRDLIKKKQDTSIMLIRFDDTNISGVFSIDGYVNATGREPNDIAALIIERLQILQRDRLNTVPIDFAGDLLRQESPSTLSADPVFLNSERISTSNLPTSKYDLSGGELEPHDNTQFRLLHISDFHRSGDVRFGANELVEELLADIQKLASTPSGSRLVDAIVFSGDTVQRGESTEEYTETKTFLNLLYSTLLPDFHKLGDHSRLILVPGNHDVDWNRCKRAIRGYRDDDGEGPEHELKLTDRTSMYFEKAAYRAKFDNFAKLLKEVTQQDWPSDFAKQVIEYSLLQPDPTTGLPGIVALGVNSAYLVHHERNNAGLHTEVCGLAKSLLRTKYPENTWIRFLILHHPLSNDDPPPSDHLSYVDISGLLKDISLVLHGHIHKHRVRRQTQLGGGELPVIGAGTIFAKSDQRPEAVGHEYNFVTIDLRNRTATVFPRTRDHSGTPWRADNRWMNDGATKYSVPLAQTDVSHVSSPILKSSFSPTVAVIPPEDWRSIRLFDKQVERRTLFQPLEDFARRRDIVFALGGVGSGLTTFQDQFNQFLEEKHNYSFSSADFSPDVYHKIHDARTEIRATAANYIESTDYDQFDLKCLLATLAYTTYYSLRQHFASGIDCVFGGIYAEQPVLFAEYYFHLDATAMFNAELGPIVELFFRTLQRMAEATGTEGVIVFMPWSKLAACFARHSDKDQKKIANDLWTALGDFAVNPGPYRVNSRDKTATAPFDKYDKVCLIIAASELPYGHSAYKMALVGKSLWPIPPLDINEVSELLGMISQELKDLKLADALIKWSGGTPWYVRLILSCAQYLFEASDAKITPLHGQALIEAACKTTENILVAGPASVTGPLKDFLARYMKRVEEVLGDGEATDPIIEEAWAGPKHKWEHGLDPACPRAESFVASGLTWLGANPRKPASSQSVFDKYPTLFFRRAGRLPLVVYGSITGRPLEFVEL